jgi:hypothetical protein
MPDMSFARNISELRTMLRGRWQVQPRLSPGKHMKDNKKLSPAGEEIDWKRCLKCYQAVLRKTYGRCERPGRGTWFQVCITPILERAPIAFKS